MKALSGFVEAGIILGAFVLLWFASGFIGDYELQIAFRVLIYLTLAESWNLLAGSVGLVSLGTSCFVGLGAYVAFGLLNGAGIPLPVVLRAGRRRAGGAGFAGIVSPARPLFYRRHAGTG
jgi:ABC-type branched-subunit amino acid transport system permease subunit